jgi:uncharacterized protein (DUF433 family)
MTTETMESLLRNLIERVERLEAKLDHPNIVALMTPRVVEGSSRHHTPLDWSSSKAQSDDAIPGRWQGRLTFDRDVSEDSPVVKGTLVTVNHVVSLILDGWTYADIIRAHPDLTEDDIRACLAYNFTMHSG